MLFALLALLAFSFQGSRPIWEPDEGRYTAIALEMLDSGDWWTPRLNAEEIHLAKPPLTYWLLAVSIAFFGHSEWAVRVPAALAFLLTGFLVFDIARRIGLPRPQLAALVWGTSLAPFVAANLATSDVILALFETGAMAAAVRAGVHREGALDRRWVIGMWLVFGCAFLTKGPPALLPLLALLVYRAWRMRSLAGLFDPIGIASFTLVGFTWFIAMVGRDPSLLSYFLYYEFVARIVSGVHHRNDSWGGLAKAYLPMVLAGAFPWLLIAPVSRSRVPPVESRPSAVPFLLTWLLLPLAIFAVARSRLPLYLLPLFVPAALLLQPFIAKVAQERSRTFASVCGLWVITLVAMKAMAAHAPFHRDDRALSQAVRRSLETMSEAADGIVFVGHGAAYGLRFYTDMQVERVDLHLPQTQRTASARELVCQEAAAREHPLWLVPSRQVSEFERVLDRCGYRVRALAPVGDWESIEVRHGLQRAASARLIEEAVDLPPPRAAGGRRRTHSR